MLCGSESFLPCLGLLSCLQSASCWLHGCGRFSLQSYPCRGGKFHPIRVREVKSMLSMSCDPVCSFPQAARESVVSGGWWGGEGRRGSVWVMVSRENPQQACLNSKHLGMVLKASSWPNPAAGEAHTVSLVSSVHGVSE